MNLSSFDTTKVTNTKASNLVGVAGTAYVKIATNKTYARIDGGISNPVYFYIKN